MNTPDESAIRWMALACCVAGAALAFALRPAAVRNADAAVKVASAGALPPAQVWNADEVHESRGQRFRRAVVSSGHGVRHTEAGRMRSRGVVVWGADQARRPEARHAGARQACPPGEDRTRTMSMDDGEGTRRVEWADASCEMEVVIEGEVTFNADFSEFAAISPGGRVRMTERGGDVDRQLEIRPGSGGALTYTWRVSGRVAPFDAEAREWLRSIVPELLRTSGIAAAERTAWLVRTQGSEGLFREIPLLRGDRAQRKYLEAWFEMGPHGVSDTARGLEVAGSQVNSDRELSAVLRLVGPGELSDASVRRAFLGATATIESDRELAGLLTAVMDGETLSVPELEVVLESSQTIHSDRELAEVLLKVIDEAAIDGSLRDPFMSALGTIESDREYGRVASALLRGG